jgi:rhamnose utilization protein RhaD (predicted bifunctional aldolase and dehydrogenase)
VNNITNSIHLKAQIIEYCAVIGADPLLVQGAGGNVSWKEGDKLWVKASGTWLAEAAEKDTFVPVDLSHLRKAIKGRDFNVAPKVIGESRLRPSIETLLHALMPHQVVVHLHAIEVLAYLVRSNFENNFESLLNNLIPLAVIDYYKPGAALAEAICNALIDNPTTKVIFLKNHGIVVGGSDVAEVSQIISSITLALSNKPADNYHYPQPMPIVPKSIIGQYALVDDLDIHQLALNDDYYKRLSSDWALYPDHVVFLGPKAHTYSNFEAFYEEKIFLNEKPELIFIKNLGVYIKSSFSKAKQVQLRCYFDVIVRQESCTEIRALTNLQIIELLNWDAEHYRMNLANDKND